MNGQGGMDDFSFSTYAGMEYGNAPVDVEATLNSLLESPTEPYDFSASLLSSSNNLNVHNLNHSSTTIYHQQTVPLIPPPPAPSHFHNPVVSPSNKNVQINTQTNPNTPTNLNTSTQSQLDVKRKRRKKDDILPDEVCKGFDWTTYQAPQVNYVVYDALTMQPLAENLDVMLYKSGTNTHFSSSEKAWISYRQNQFKIFCLLKTPQSDGQLFIRDGAMDVEVHQFYVKLYAIKSSATGMSEEVQVGLCHAGKSRVKKEKTEIVPIPFIEGRAEFTNLQFERSNAAKGQQEYFHLVATIYAKSPTAYYPVISKVSPRIIVRSQHPGFYGPPSPEQDLAQTNTSYTSSENASPKVFENDPSWQQSGDSVFRIGKVGINTSDPTEALTVHGNALVTGNIYKPSDRRIKSDFVAVDSTEQLDHIRNLKIYDYKIKERDERGVIAQELQEVMSSAVYEAGDVNINGKTIQNLLVVNERSLLYENIGATQQLDKQLEIEKSNIIEIDNKVDDLQAITAQENAELKDRIKSVSDMFFAAESSKSAKGKAGREEQVIFGVNLFRMGPARSFMVLGYFVSYLWLIGALYVFSSLRARRFLGRACLLKFAVWWALNRWVFIRRGGLGGELIYWGIGLVLLIGNWWRNKKRIKEKAKESGKAVEEEEGMRGGWKCWGRSTDESSDSDSEAVADEKKRLKEKRRERKNRGR